LLWTLVTAAAAEETHAYRIAAKAECPLDAVDAHVREQIAKYGPLSSDREYFGFIFIVKGEIGSAITRGRLCYSHTSCAVDTALAAPRIPKGAKVLGEWHTHPKLSSALLSDDDVRGAQNNRRIRCYAPYFSQPDGDIYAWDAFQTSVPTAMSSLVLIGNFLRAAADDTRMATTRLPIDNTPRKGDEREDELSVDSADLR
jgi:hypothetical protein